MWKKIWMRILFRFSEFKDTDPTVVYRSEAEFNTVDGTLVNLAIRERTSDFLSYIRSRLNLENLTDAEILDPEVTHLRWILEGEVTPSLWASESDSEGPEMDSMSSIQTSSAETEEGNLPFKWV